MGFLIVLLWIVVAIHVLNILILPTLVGRVIATTYSPGVIALRSTISMVFAVIVALAAIFLA